MLALFLSLFSSTVSLPTAEVETVPAEFDAIWVPPGATGPFVAMPGPNGSCAFL